MSKHQFLLIFLGIFSPLVLSGQPTVGDRIEARTANDVFYFPHKTDRYFTSGFTLEYTRRRVVPGRRISPFSRLETRVKERGWLLTQNIYTPDNIYTEAFQPGDRPFASVLTVARRRATIHPASGFSFGHEWQLGVLGRPGLGRVLQNGYHSLVAFADEVPGWSYEVKADVIVNFNSYLSGTVPLGKFIRLRPSVKARAGSLALDLQPAVACEIQLLKLLGVVEAGEEKISYRATLETAARFTAHDATLTGGLFHVDRRYRGVILPDRLRGMVGIGSYLQVGRLTVGAGLNAVDRAFIGGESHGWGWFAAKWE